MGVIKGVLKEELANSLKMQSDYEREIKKLPRGSLVKKCIKGREYYYLLFREDGKVKFVYKGKVPEQEIKRYQEAKELRARYRNLLSRVKKQVRFLRSSLRGKESI
ncbi:MAG: hypothetical protein HQL22_11555 [Candidatus Omnitrophica bacterium]|nr:hypothetical protein [Candidatus Omnitrophota bacterium]